MAGAAYQSLTYLLVTGWKMPVLITVFYGFMNFIHGKTKTRLKIQDEELPRAREIQESLLPKPIPQLPGFEVA